MTDGDFTVAPWLYPGTPAPHSGILSDGAFTRVASEEFPPLSGRRIVVAVGSNGAPSVISRKLGGTPVPFVTGTVSGLIVGHSAHVSRYGFVPAAPAKSAGVETRVVATWLDEAQLAALDATEPNYTRQAMSTSEPRLVLDAAQPPDEFDVYVSRWGVLSEPDVGVIALRPQEHLFEHVLPRCAPAAALLEGLGPPRETMRALAANEPLRAAVRAAFNSSGWARP